MALMSWSERYPVAIRVTYPDISSFAEEVVKLLKDEKLRKYIGEKSREFAKTLSWEKAAEMEKKAIYKIMESK